MISKSFIDLKEPRANSLRDSFDVSITHLNRLPDYFAKCVVPCFPKYYDLYNVVQQTYLEAIKNHLMTYHFCNLEKYMKSDDVDLSETNAEILLECFAFLLTVKSEILGEPREEFDVKHNT
jgi:hypothetical protein